MSEADKKALVMVCRALITSRPEATIFDLSRDYRDTEGCNIPFQKFGHHNMEAFLESTGEFQVQNKRIYMRASYASEHIKKLVAEQNTKRKKKKPIIMPPQRNIHSSSYSNGGASRYAPVYSTAYQNMKSRSPFKYQANRNYNSNVNNIVKPTAAFPERPVYKLDGSNGFMQPINQLARQQSCDSNGGSNNMAALENFPARRAITKSSENLQHRKTTEIGNGGCKSPKKVKSPPPSMKSPPPPYQQQQTGQAATLQVQKQMQEAQQLLYQAQQHQVQKLNQSSHNEQQRVPINQRLQQAPPTSVDIVDFMSISSSSSVSSGEVAIQRPPYQNGTSSNAPGTSKLQNRLKISPKVSTVETPNRQLFQQISLNEVPVSRLNSRLIRLQSNVSDTTFNRPANVSNNSDFNASQTNPPPISSTNPNNFSGNPPKNNNTLPSSAVDELAVYCQNKNYSHPEYKIFKMQKTGRIQCRVLINGTTYSTYPHDFGSVHMARLETAREALSQLQQLNAKEEYPMCMDPDSELAVKVYDCLKLFKHGLFCRNMPEIFQNSYKMSLPENWCTLVMNAPQLFTLNCSVDNKIIYANLDITDDPNVSNQSIDEVDATTQSNSGSLTNGMSITSNGSKSKRLADTKTTNHSHMDKLDLPWSDKHWNLLITNPKSTVEVWGRLIGPEHSDKMELLYVDIELDLMTERRQPATIIVGHIYLVVISECCHRVRIMRNDPTEKRCLCFRIDVGDEDWFSADEIYESKMEFLKFPAQAFCLSLFKLEDLAEHPSAKKYLESYLMNKALIGEVVSKYEDYEAQEASNDIAAKVNVSLYDTSSEEDVLLNDFLMEQICADNVAPTLQPDGLSNVIISHICDNGDVYCQIRMTTGGVHYVQKLIHHIVQFDFNRQHHRLTGDEVEKHMVAFRKPVYLIYDSNDKRWYRARILHIHPMKYEMFYVDYGMARMIDKTEVYRLDSLSMALFKYSSQAILCRLHDVHNFTDSFISSLKWYLNSNTPAIVKVMSSCSTVPMVNIFIRFNAGGPLNCINNLIQVEQEIKSSPEIIDCTLEAPLFPIEKAAKDTPLNGHESLPFLEKSKPPSVDEMFAVHVTMAPNPHNFKVRSDRQIVHFQKLMIDLQEYCQHFMEYVADEDVVLGQAYACKQEDDIWYRAIVEKVYGPAMFLISYCDYGDIAIVNSDRLKVLPANFRTLPQLAMSAKLYGIIPKNTDWETEDCLYFQQLTVDKRFVSRIDKISYKNDDEFELELTLYDVSTEQDIIINSNLVLEGRAKDA